MENNRLRRFSVFIIGIGSLLVLVSVIKGVTMLITFFRGIPLYTQRDISVNVISVAFNFVIPFAGGVLLILSGITIMQMYEEISHRKIIKQSERSRGKEVGTIINSSLNQNEKAIVEIISSYPDGALQSDIVLKSGFSKVKVHRILKKLENRGLVKRGRFGITNRVILNFQNKPLSRHEG